MLERAKEQNETIASEEEYEALHPAIIAYAWMLILGLWACPPLTCEDREDLLSMVNVKFWRSWRRIPRDRGQRAYIGRAVYGALYESRKKWLPYAVVVLAENADIEQVLPNSRVSAVKSPAKFGLEKGRKAYRGRIRGRQLSDLRADPRVKKLIVCFDGEFHPVPNVDDDGHEVPDPMEQLAVAEPFPNVEARLDRETILATYRNADPLGVAIWEARHVKGASWKAIARITGLPVGRARAALKRLYARAGKDFPEFVA